MCDAELILELPTASLAEVMPTNKEGEAQIQIRITPEAANEKEHQQLSLASPPTTPIIEPPTKNQNNNDELLSSPPTQPQSQQQQQQQQQLSAINIISIVPTEAQVIETQDEIGLKEKHQVQPTPSAPLVFILAGEYKIPLRKEVPCISITNEGQLPGIIKAYQFDVLGLQLQIQFPVNTPRLTIQHFEEVLIMQHCLGISKTEIYTNHQTTPTYSNSNNNSSSALASSSGSCYVQPQWDMPESGANGPQNTSTTNAILKGVDSVGTGVSKGLRTGAVVLASGITSAAQFLVSHTDKSETAVAVPESWQSGVKTARVASKGAVKVSSGVAKSLIGVTSVVSDVVAAKLRTIIKKDGKDDDEDPDSDTVRSLKLIGITSADQAVSLYEAATDSARTILTATCAGICQVVEHKLGEHAGTFAEDGLGLVQDTYDATKAVGSVGTKGFVRGTLKATAVKT